MSKKKQVVDGKLTCSRCKELKLTSEFFTCAKLSSGFMSHCKVCDNNLRTKTRHAKSPPKEGCGRSGKPGQPPKIVVDGRQLCAKCNEWKPVDLFTFSSRSTTGFSYRCKSCDNLYYQKEVENLAARKRRQIAAKTWNQANGPRRWQNKKADIQQLLRDYLRSRLSRAIVAQLGNPRPEGWPSAVRDLGCSIPELMAHLEARFTEGMTWKNYRDWHIDHVKALANFDLTDPEQVKVACHFSNLQPLWAADNISKGDR